MLCIRRAARERVCPLLESIDRPISGIPTNVRGTSVLDAYPDGPGSSRLHIRHPSLRMRVPGKGVRDWGTTPGRWLLGGGEVERGRSDGSCSYLVVRVCMSTSRGMP